MITTDAGRKLSNLRIERTQHQESEGAGSRPLTMYGPAGVVLENDGRHHHWMTPGEDYGVRHDGTGWQVTCQTWQSGHVYRLGDGTGAFTDRLPGEDGDTVLAAGQEYTLRSTGNGTWALHAA